MWLPPKQGLKLIFIILQSWYNFMFELWLPPKQGLKLVMKFGKDYKPTLFELWLPPKQGLKHPFSRTEENVIGVWIVTSTKTRIETSKWSEDIIRIQCLNCDFHQNKDWNRICFYCNGKFIIVWIVTSTKTRIETR